MNVVHRITGYNKRTERLEIEYDIPDEDLGAVRRLAHIPEQDADDDFGSLPLQPDEARAVAQRINKTINLDAFDWFLEPFAV